MERAAPAEALAHALADLERVSRTRPISVSLPGPLIDALQGLVEDRVVTSASAAVAEALTGWLHNRLLRLTLDEIYADQPDLRPDAADIDSMARRVGVILPADGNAVA